MLDKILKKRYFYNVYIGVLFILSLIIVITGQQVLGAVLFGCIATLCLVLFSSLMPFIIPILLLSVFVTVCYDSFDTFIRFIPLAFPLVGCIVFNLVRYKVKPKKGPSLRGLVMVALAVTLGGTGTLPLKDYFSPTSMFYVFMLGGGMILLYLLFTARLTSQDSRELAWVMYAVGLLASFVIVFHYYQNWDVFISGRKFLSMQASNNLCTFIMLALPFPMYRARKRQLHVFVALFMYLCMIISSSRGGLIMGSLEILILFFVYTFCYENRLYKQVFHLAVIACGFVLVYRFLPEVILKITNKSLMFAPDKPVFSQTFELFQRYFFGKKEPRLDLIKRSFIDFGTNPIFGVGIGYQGNSDLYSPVSGAMNWYHMWTAQVIGGGGILGILAYGFQFISRAVIYTKHRTPLNMTLFMSYLGLWLMSQINPGEFCPIPYAMIAVIYFVLIERTSNETSKAHPLLQGLHMGREKVESDIRQRNTRQYNGRKLGSVLPPRRRNTSCRRKDTQGIYSVKSRSAWERKALRRISRSNKIHRR